jgi:PucR-like helix-turn-helix protein/diguanylate cyclase with GGDEF domain
VRTRVGGIVDAGGDVDAAYAEGMHTAVSIAIDYGLTAIERGEQRTPPVPAALLAQARVAARSGVSLDTVLRRYFAGYTLLGDFLIQEVEGGGLLQGVALQSVMRAPAAVFDRVVVGVTEEYTRESQELSSSGKGQRAERIRRLLSGELLDTSELAYALDIWHLGLLVVGAGADEAVREIAVTIDRRLLFVSDGGETLWAWLGGRRKHDSAELKRVAEAQWPSHMCLALGEPAYGLAGWRLTHQQAKAALPIALCGPERLVRYGEVALLASILQDDLLVTSLRQLYLTPLTEERDGGQTLRETLRAYFTAGRNASSAAAALGVSRRTVANRLRSIERRLDRPLGAALPEVEAALCLQEFDATVDFRSEDR